MSGVGRQRVHFIADFNIETLARLVAHTEVPGAEVSTAPFGQVMPALAGAPPGTDWTVVVWTQPESVVEEVAQALESAAGEPDPWWQAGLEEQLGQ